MQLWSSWPLRQSSGPTAAATGASPRPRRWRMEPWSTPQDRKGQEQIFVHAQRDWDENIEHDQNLSYQGNNLTITKALLNVIADAKTKEPDHHQGTAQCDRRCQDQGLWRRRSGWRSGRDSNPRPPA